MPRQPCSIYRGLAGVDHLNLSSRFRHPLPAERPQPRQGAAGADHHLDPRDEGLGLGDQRIDLGLPRPARGGVKPMLHRPPVAGRRAPTGAGCWDEINRKLDQVCHCEETLRPN